MTGIITFTILLGLIHAQDSQDWDDIRLVGGDNPYRGRVEVKINGTWGTVCDDKWSLFDGYVACRQLGFDAASQLFGGGYFGHGSGPIWHDDLGCVNVEQNLGQCPGIHDPKLSDCSHLEDAGLECRQPSPSLTEPRCRSNQYLCNKRKMCIPRRWLCNNHTDCEDGNDEMGIVCDNIKTCGIQTVPPRSHRIVGGDKATKGSWPWMASLRVVFPKKLNQSEHLCGATLIDKQWVLTAAHCFDKFRPEVHHFRVRLGDYKQSVFENTEQEVNLSQIHLHEHYVAGTHANDIALLKLESVVTLNRKHINVICLPNGGISDFSSADYCYTTGWGSTQASVHDDTLRQVQVPVINTTTCRAWYGGAVIQDNMLCAGYEYGGKDACKGDSGGPLSCRKDNRWYLAGVVSWGDGCARPLHPGVYTNVKNFVSWIAKKIADDKSRTANDPGGFGPRPGPPAGPGGFHPRTGPPTGPGGFGPRPGPPAGPGRFGPRPGPPTGPDGFALRRWNMRRFSEACLIFRAVIKTKET